MIDVIPEVYFNNQLIPATAFTIHSATYGSIGHIDITTSSEALVIAGVDPIGIAINATETVPINVYLTVPNFARSHIFGGEYVLSKWSFDHATVDIHGRDRCGRLVDQKRILSNLAAGITQALAPDQVAGKGVETQNQKLSQVVTAIAQQFKLTPELHLQGGDPELGTIFGSDDSIYWPTPQSLWSILTHLARDTGYEVYVTPDGHLVFGTPGAGLTPVNLAYGYPVTGQPAGTTPCYGLDIEHNPRRNLTFRVLVLSYDPATAKLTKGQAVILGTNVTLPTGSTVRSGLWTGSDADAIGSKLDSTGQDKKFPIYTFRLDGLTAAQAQARATAIATDIAKRELILTASTEVLPTLLPLNPLTLASPVVSPLFTSHQFWVTAYTHTYRVGRRAELNTTVTALDLQLSGAGDPVVSGQKEA